ncbi:MAG TPA: hypothetical protein VGC91_03930 [Pyrinomonadaceae bacterium]|jgi:hypothetical protein
MRKIDRLGWTDGIAILSYGVRVGIRVNDSRAMERILKLLPPGWKPASSPVVESLFSVYLGGASGQEKIRRFNLLYGGMQRLVRSFDETEIYTTLESNLRLTVAEAARRRVFVHAGVVGWKGMAIVIPGRSFSGKTTLVRELLRAGATYYSDEYAVLDQQGRVHPFAKPLSIRESGTADQTDYTVEALGGEAGKKPLPVGLVVISDYKAGARWRPQKLTAGQGALELLAHTISARRQPEVALSTLHRVASRASVLKSKRGEARHVIDSILKTIA